MSFLLQLFGVCSGIHGYHMTKVRSQTYWGRWEVTGTNTTSITISSWPQLLYLFICLGILINMFMNAWCLLFKWARGNFDAVYSNCVFRCIPYGSFFYSCQSHSHSHSHWFKSFYINSMSIVVIIYIHLQCYWSCCCHLHVDVLPFVTFMDAIVYFFSWYFPDLSLLGRSR